MDWEDIPNEEKKKTLNDIVNLVSRHHLFGSVSGERRLIVFAGKSVSFLYQVCRILRKCMKSKGLNGFDIVGVDRYSGGHEKPNVFFFHETIIDLDSYFPETYG